MNQIKIRKFIATLRKEKGMTQEPLGEKLGVTNKTVSRWETGTYLPDVEMLSLLSQAFGVSLNELVAGERLAAENFQQAADHNLEAALTGSAFTLEERVAFFKKKWRREHLASILLATAVWIFAVVTLKLQDVEPALWGGVVGLLAVLLYVVLYNRMMAYVEKNAYRPNRRKVTSGDTLHTPL